MKYETIFLISSKLDEEQRTTLYNRVVDFIQGCTKITSHEEWGLRKLAYPIKENEKAYYYLLEFETENEENAHNIKDFYNNFEYILKNIIVKKN